MLLAHVPLNLLIAHRVLDIAQRLFVLKEVLLSHNRQLAKLTGKVPRCQGQTQRQGEGRVRSAVTLFQCDVDVGDGLGDHVEL